MVKSKHQKEAKRRRNTEQYDFMLPGTHNYSVYHTSASAKVCVCVPELKPLTQKFKITDNHEYVRTIVRK